MNAALWILVAFLSLGLLSQALHNNSHNEQMYVTAGYLMAHGQQLYNDFAFVQTPYVPLTFALFIRLFGSHYLLIAKLINVTFFAASAFLLYIIARRETHDGIFATTLLALFLANYYLLRTVIEASNYTMPMAFSLAAYYVFMRGSDRDSPVLANLLTGLFVALAVGGKLYYATLALPFGLAVLLYPKVVPLRTRLLRGALPMLIGGIVGALPLFYYAVRDWDRFAFNNLGYHLLNAQWREVNGNTATMTWASKLDTARDLLANPSYLLIVAWTLLAIIVLWTQAGNSWRRMRDIPASLFLSGLLAVVSLVTAFTPRPLFPQYFAMPIPFFLVFMSALYVRIAQPQRRMLLQSSLIAVALLTITVLPRHTGSLKRWLQQEQPLAGIESVAVSRVISEAMGGAEGGRVATLSPVYAIEADLPIYPELATGSFVFRIGDLLTADERTKYHATSVSTISALFEADPPAAILITDEGVLETPLRDYAESHGYRLAPNALPVGELYLR